MCSCSCSAENQLPVEIPGQVCLFKLPYKGQDMSKTHKVRDRTTMHPRKLAVDCSTWPITVTMGPPKKSGTVNTTSAAASSEKNSPLGQSAQALPMQPPPQLPGAPPGQTKSGQMYLNCSEVMGMNPLCPEMVLSTDQFTAGCSPGHVCRCMKAF